MHVCVKCLDPCFHLRNFFGILQSQFFIERLKRFNSRLDEPFFRPVPIGKVLFFSTLKTDCYQSFCKAYSKLVLMTNSLHPEYIKTLWLKICSVKYVLSIWFFTWKRLNPRFLSDFWRSFSRCKCLFRSQTFSQSCCSVKLDFKKW